MSTSARARTTLGDVVTSLVVCLLGLGVLMFVVSIAVIGGGHRHQRADRTRLDIENLEKALKLHFAKTGRYPATTAGLTALIDLGILDKEPHDGWGNPYRYELIDGRPVITSFGSDGQPGGEGDAVDIWNAPTMAAGP